MSSSYFSYASFKTNSGAPNTYASSSNVTLLYFVADENPVFEIGLRPEACGKLLLIASIVMLSLSIAAAKSPIS